jgi:hypothetical protein
MTAMPKQLLFLLLTLVLAVSAAACGGGDDDDDDAGDASETTAETAAETPGCPDATAITDAVGVASTGPEETDAAGLYLQCLYDVEDSAAGVFGVVAVKIYGDDARGSLDIFKDVLDDEAQVTGLGDEAWWAPTTENLFVVDGDIGLDILLSGMPEGADAQAIATAIAEATLA